MLTVGVLALQGAFAKHIEMLLKMGVHAIEVRKPEELDKCDALIIPGGESTTMTRQMHFIKLFDKIKEFSLKKPIFGTCAGLILMANEILESEMKSFNLIDIKVVRNAFGRQADSFIAEIPLRLSGKTKPLFPAIFIRAPRIKDCGKDVEILASFEGEPVLVRQGHHLAATFHPELTNDCSVHRYFLSIIKM